MNKAPTWFFVLAAIALAWNLLGAFAVIMNFMITPEEIAMLPLEQQQMYADSPKWATYASLVAVIAGSLGCLCLLLKKELSKPLFLLSIVGLVLQDIGIFVIVDAVSVMGSGVLFMQIFVFIMAVGLYFLSTIASRNGWFLSKTS